MAAVFGGLQGDKYDRQYSDTYLFRRIGDYIAEHKWPFRLAMLGFLVVALARAVRPVFISIAVDEMVSGGDVLNLILIVLTLFAVTEYICNYGRRRFTVVVIGRIVAQMRKDCFEAAIERDLAFYDRHKTGAVISRITSDTQEFGDVMLLGSEVISQFLTVTILFAALLSHSVELSIVLILTMPFVIAAALVFRYVARIVTRQGARAMAVVNDNIQESVTGISVAKNFRQEEMIYNEFSAVNILSYKINLRRGFIMSLVFPDYGHTLGNRSVDHRLGQFAFRPRRRLERGHLVSVHSERRSVLVSLHESGVILESISAGLERSGTHFRLDRRREHGRPDRQFSGDGPWRDK